MCEKIDNMQSEIVSEFDALIPIEYKEAWLFFQGGTGVMSTMWFCFSDIATGNVFPSDCLSRRKDIIVNDFDAYEQLERKLLGDIIDLQKEYKSLYENEWHTMTCRLDQSGKFDISFSYEKPTGSWQERREKWCMEHLGIMPPTVKVDMLRDEFL